MSIPDYQSIMLPALKFVAEKGSAKSNEVFSPVIKHFKLSAEEANTLLPSGKQRIIDNRTQWALFYLYKAGLLERPKRGLYVIANEGKAVLKKGLDKINIDLLNNYESFRQFRSLPKKEKADGEENKDREANENPEEAIDQNFEIYQAAIVSDLINKVRSIDPIDFERLIINLLKKMGYGVGDKSVLHLGCSGLFMLQKYGKRINVPGKVLKKLKVIGEKFGLKDIRPANIMKFGTKFKIINAERK